MSDTKCPDGEPKGSEPGKGAATRSEISTEGPDEFTSDKGRSRDGRDAGTESEPGSIEPKFGFAPAIELAGKRDKKFSRLPDKPGFGFAAEIGLSTQRGKPRAQKPFGGRFHRVPPAAPFLPYEAAQLSNSASSLLKPRFGGKLIPACLAAVISTVSVVSAAAVWITQDGEEIIPSHDPSTAGIGAFEPSLLDREIHQQITQSPKRDIAAAEPRTDASSTASHDRAPEAKGSVAYSSSSTDKHAALTSIVTDDAKHVREQPEGNAISKPATIRNAPSTLVAAASSPSTIGRQALAIGARYKWDQMREGAIQKADDQLAFREEPLSRQTKLPHRPELKPVQIAAAMSAIYNSQQLKLPHLPKMKPLMIAATSGSSKAFGGTIFIPASKPRNLASELASAVVARAERAPVIVRIWRSLFGSSAGTALDGNETGQVVFAANDLGESVGREIDNRDSSDDRDDQRDASDKGNGGNDNTSKGNQSSSGKQADKSDKGGKSDKDDDDDDDD